MHTSVETQKLVTVTMSVEEWADWLEKPQTLLVQIQNLALTNVEPSTNGHKARRPKAATKRRINKITTSYVCPQCDKKYKTQIRLQKHMDRNHVASTASD